MGLRSGLLAGHSITGTSNSRRYWNIYYRRCMRPGVVLHLRETLAYKSGVWHDMLFYHLLDVSLCSQIAQTWWSGYKLKIRFSFHRNSAPNSPRTSSKSHSFFNASLCKSFSLSLVNYPAPIISIKTDFTLVRSQYDLPLFKCPINVSTSKSKPRLAMRESLFWTISRFVRMQSAFCKSPSYSPFTYSYTANITKLLLQHQ